MQAVQFIDLKEAAHEYREQAARILLEAFAGSGTSEWHTMASCRREVTECRAGEFLCFGSAEGTRLTGWIGFRPMYDTCTWELHPLAVDPAFAGRGFGRALVAEGERRLLKLGALNVVLGSDDLSGRTSLSGRDLSGPDLFDHIRSIRNIGRHPYEFYEKQGYRIVGVIPDASGKGKPDIWMWKRIAP